MSALINRLTRDHRRFGRVMGLLEALLDHFHAGDEPDYELMCELLEYVVDYADQVHHPSEELIFAAMHQAIAGVDAGQISAGAQAVLAVIDGLLDQHQRLAAANRAFRDSLEGIVHETVLSRDTVEQEGRSLVALLREHIAVEESQVFTAAGELLSEAEWETLNQAAPQAADPVFGQLDPLRFQALYEHLKDELISDSGD